LTKNYVRGASTLESVRKCWENSSLEQEHINNNSTIFISFLLQSRECTPSHFPVADTVHAGWLESGKVITFRAHEEYGSNWEPRLPSQSHFRDCFGRRLHFDTETIHILLSEINYHHPLTDIPHQATPGLITSPRSDFYVDY